MTTRVKRTVGLGLGGLLVLALTVLTGAQGPDVAQDYARANSARTRLNNKQFDTIDTSSITWVDGSDAFTYRKSVRGGNEFELVDPVARTKTPAFDHTKVAAALTTAAAPTTPYTATTLPFSSFTFAANRQAIDFTIGGGGGGRAGGGARGGGAPGAGAPALPRWHCTLTDYTCTRANAPADPGPAGPPQAGGRGAGGRGAGQGRGGNGGNGGATAIATTVSRTDGVPMAAGTVPDPPQMRRSPDGTTDAFIENFNIFLRAASVSRPTPGTQLSWDGSEGNAYTFNSIQWSPDSKHIAAFRRRPGYQRMVHYVQSSPSDQLQPKFTERYYQKPGDVVDYDQPVLFDVAAKRETAVDTALFPNPYSNGRIQWRKDSHAFTFDYNQRGHQLYRVIEVDAASGKARTVIEEKSDTFIDYRAPTAGLTDSGRTYRYDVNDGKEVIWMSERDGWAHLYLYDGTTGQVKNQITKGEWPVHNVERVDEAKRQIYFTATGMDAGKDPYLINYFRINFDGTGLVRFTTGDGYHALNNNWEDHPYYVDTYSRVDMPPVSELRRTSDQSLVMTLEKADITDLTAAGWKMPEVFSTKGRDGRTDIWGEIIKPTNFDPTQKYPVIENIYAGPQGSFVPKQFSNQLGMQTLAELGFIVVQIDGMGTANRSKAFHATAWKNLADAGFPDRILWHKAVAAKYPWYDATRVGIYGTSAGGQNAAGAVIFHPEFYKAAASFAGCHDNRMDKIWWNEQWMGWPIGPEYSASSNTDNAYKLGGALLLGVGEMDTNVDPSSTMQVVNKLILANKNFDLLVIPNSDHTGGGSYGDHKRFDFFVHHLRGLEPPAWGPVTAAQAQAERIAPSVLDADAMPWVASEDTGFDIGG